MDKTKKEFYHVLDEYYYTLWVNYKLGNIKLEDLPDDPKIEKEFRANTFAAHLLVPTDELLKLVGGEKNLIKSFDSHKLEELSEYFGVEEVIIIIQLRFLIEETNKKKKKQKVKSLIDSVKGNVIKLKSKKENC